jgi:hypothetical protein
MSDTRSSHELDGGDRLSAITTGEHGDEADTDTVLEDKLDAEGLAETDDPGRPSRIAAWLLLVGVMALAGLFVAIPAHTYYLDPANRAILDVRRVDLFELWRVQTSNLPDVEHETVLQTFFVLSGLVALSGSAALIWLATVEIVPQTPREDEPHDPPGEVATSP